MSLSAEEEQKSIDKVVEEYLAAIHCSGSEIQEKLSRIRITAASRNPFSNIFVG